MASFAWPIHTVLLVLVVGCFHKLAVVLHFHVLAIVVGQYFRKLEIIVPTGPLQTVVDIDGS